MGVASERAVSIPQITYDHIDDSEEKKDATFFRDEQRGSVEGNIPGWLLYYEVSMLISWRRFFPLATHSTGVPQTSLHAFLLKTQTPCQYNARKGSTLFPVWFSWPHFTPLINRDFIVNLTPPNAMFFEECAFSYTSRSFGIRACVTQRTFCTVWRSKWRHLGNQRSSVAPATVLFDDMVHIKYCKMMSREGLGIPIISVDAWRVFEFRILKLNSPWRGTAECDCQLKQGSSLESEEYSFTT